MSQNLQTEIPPVESFHREIAVWDPAEAKWKRGRRTDILIPQNLVEIIWTNKSAATDQVPDSDTVISVLYANRIAIQIDSTHASNTSTDIDINVETTLDGVNWDTVPYAERNIGDAEIKTFLVEVSVAKIRLRLDNNTASSVAYVTARVQVVK